MSSDLPDREEVFHIGLLVLGQLSVDTDGEQFDTTFNLSNLGSLERPGDNVC